MSGIRVEVHLTDDELEEKLEFFYKEAQTQEDEFNAMQEVLQRVTNIYDNS